MSTSRVIASWIAGLSLGVVLATPACERPATVELGGACTDNAQCKSPADTCMQVAGKQRCTMACAKDRPCPTGYACPVTDPARRDVGSCLVAGDVGPDVLRAY